jgi:lipopolysaccharide/colanic/teichoic acid biosynthesis glycosyltransferase
VVPVDQQGEFRLLPHATEPEYAAIEARDEPTPSHWAEGSYHSSSVYLAVKRWSDVVVASALLVLLLPVLAAISLAIWTTTRRSPIFRQMRVGLNGRLFVVYKFSTMIPDRRKTPMEIAMPERRRRHKSLHDPRVTPIGRFLRRTSLDELPQLLNVVRGDMSLVGPRPELPEIVASYAPWQNARHMVRPGMTGWWQVQGRSDLPMHEHTELDIYYVRNQSFQLDLEIVFLTIRVLMNKSGAF